MADRFVLKQFAGSATNNGAFGAAQATGAGVQFVTNIKDVQSLNAFEQGWDSATLTADKLPALEEMQGLEALLCKAIKELYSEGIPLWISGETYYQYSFVNYNGVIYYNTTGSYTANNPAIDTANWSEYKPSAAGVADKLGTATVGNETIPIYLDNGTATPCKQTAITVYANVKTYSLNEVVMTLDTNNNVKFYKSLANNNTSALSDDTKWEEVSLGGGGGGEIGDVMFAPLGIDETLNLRRYLNGQVISQSQFVSFTNKVKSAIALYPNLATTEANWQAEKTNSKLGQCGKFVVDDTAGTIRLPCVVNAQGLTNLALIGGIKSESLPNITGTFGASMTQGNFVNFGTGAFGSYEDPAESQNVPDVGGPYDSNNRWYFNASRSSSTYQDNAPVQQEAIQYPYCIVVATGVEETLPAIREYKVNNSDYFGKSMYSDIAPNNASWLASNGQWNARSVYPDYYDWLVGQMNAGIKGFKSNIGYAWKSQTVDVRFWTALRTPSVGCAVYGGPGIPFAGTVTAINPDGTLNFYEDSTGITYENLVYTESENINIEGTAFANLKFANDYDFVINTADQTFRLPLLDGSEDLPSDRYETLTYVSGQTYTAQANGWFSVGGEGSSFYSLIFNGKRNLMIPTGTLGYARGFGFVKRGETFYIDPSGGVTPDGLVFVYATGNGSLYFYVGDTVQDASLINAGAVLSEIAGLEAGKANTDLSNLDATGQAKFDAKANAAQFQVVSALPANPDPNVFYFIPE